jgi:hypothetical protein
MTMTNEELLTMVQERQLRAQARDEHQAAIDNLSTQIGTELVLRDKKKEEVGEWTVSLVDQERSSLVPELLLQAGVSLEQLEKGKKVSRSSSVRVTRRGI